MTNALTFEMEKTADWHKRKAERYPDDHRNLIAVSILEKLSSKEASSYVMGVIDNMETDVDDPLYDEFPTARDEVLKSIGFGFNPATVEEVATAIIRSLREYPSVEDMRNISAERAAADAAAAAAGKTAN